MKKRQGSRKQLSYKLIGLTALLAAMPFAFAADPEYLNPATDLPPMVMDPPSAADAPSPTSPLAPAPESKHEAKMEAAPPPDAATPEPAPESTSADPVTTPQPSAETAQPEQESPVAAEKSSEPSADDRASQLAEEQEDAVLEKPTQNVEVYDAVRMKKLHRTTVPTWSFNLTYEHHPFKNAELRVGTDPGALAPKNPTLYGILLGFEGFLIRRAGILGIGVDLGGYGTTTQDQFSGLAAAFLSVGPYLDYQFVYWPRQLLVPTVKAEYEVMRYSYSVHDKPVRGFRTMPRFEIGALLYLNSLEPSSAGEMDQNFGVKRTYLGVWYTMATDRQKQDFDLTDKSFKFGFRFEQ